ncbi:signal recognition particle-docking protein FtsY [Pseudodesulfovibrio cashew]|uniref:Signal recognition particle receptor FtsY n=1 Tax=Pseudodesulfovibrio cashew TaxID=2678688 RepID=A0A6I6JMP9_9BACT|nr:signal recognition particle-docking protein FtsY [Pseudodesulfovibrio cashew]QGY41397.1 signal recognition particle-docking protein FtsY [Pseudodesulfovibrio cashew]
MGFFSKLKKAWAKPEDVAQQALDEYKRQQGLDVEPEPAEEPVPEPEAAAPIKETTPEPVPAQPETDAAPVPTEDWQAGLTLSLRQAEPRLSQWLNIIVEGVEEKGPALWDRLAFLFKALGAPEDEAQNFIGKFETWLDEMGYVAVAEFKSELQYRLALALDLEDEEDERDRLFLKLSEGISKTREQITKRIDGLLSSHSSLDDDFWEEFEEILIMADVGMEAANQLMENLKARAKKAGTDDPDDFKDILRAELEDIFKVPPRIEAVNPPEVLMMVGVNGVGKTTTIAKLAHRAQMQGRKVLIAAGDTFRAAAIEQLEVWANRIGAGFFAKAEGSDPAAVAYEAMDKAVAEGYDLLLLDTAGRLHTKINLMEELKKIERVVGKKHEGAPHRTILVIDATTGQNALSQTKLFNEAVGVDEIILTKLDGTAKGGVVVAVTLQNKLPITFVGLGEKMEDLRPFNGKDFAKALLT